MKQSIVKILAFVLAATLCMTGCSSPKPDSGSNAAAPGKNASAPSQEQNTPNSSADASKVAANTQHITQQVCENLTINADAVIPGKTQYSTYTLKQLDGDPERLFGIFSPAGHGSYTKEDNSYPGSTVFRYTEASGKILVVQDLSISYYTYELGSDNPMQEIGSLMEYHTQEHPEAQPHDLSFMTVAEMESFGRNVLTQLGVTWEPKLNKCVALSGQEILDFQKEMFGKSTYTEMGNPVKLTDAADTCYLEFTFSYDGIPLLTRDEPNISSYVEMMPSMDATAMILINADGIQNFTLYTPYIVETTSEPQKVLTLDEAIAALQRKYDEEILFGTMTIPDVWMEYIPMKQDGSWVMKPYWCFKMVDPTAGDAFANADRINAITGKDMAYGG